MFLLQSTRARCRLLVGSLFHLNRPVIGATASVAARTMLFTSCSKTNSSTPFSVLLRQPPSCLRYQPVRRIYFEQESGRFVFDIVYATVIIIGGIFIGIKILGLETFVDWVYAFKEDGKQVLMKRKLLEEIYLILEESKIKPSYKTMDLALFVFSRNLEPFTQCSFHSRYGVFFGLPINLNYSHAEEADRQAELDRFLVHFDLKKDILAQSVDDEGKSGLEQLEHCLALSPEARRYMLLSMIHAATSPVDPFLNFIVLIAFPTVAYNLVSHFIKHPSGPVVGTSVFCGYALASLTMYLMQYIQQRYGSWAVFQIEAADSDDVREELHKGAREFLQKLSQLQEIVAKYAKKPQTRSMRLDSYRVYTTKRRLADLEKFARKECRFQDIIF